MPNSTKYPVGFYWVKIEGNSKNIEIHWEPAYFNGDEISGWEILGQDADNDSEDFIEIAPMEIKQSL